MPGQCHLENSFILFFEWLQRQVQASTIAKEANTPQRKRETLSCKGAPHRGRKEAHGAFRIFANATHHIYLCLLNC